MEFKTKEDLATFLAELEGRVANLQEAFDKMAPVDEAPAEGTPEEGNPAETPAEETVTEEEVSEIDKLLQED